MPAVVSLSRAPFHFWSILLHNFSFLHDCRRDRRLGDMPFLLLEVVSSPSLVGFKVLLSPVDSCAHIASVACFVWVEFFRGRQSTAYPEIAYRCVAAVSSQEVFARPLWLFVAFVLDEKPSGLESSKHADNRLHHKHFFRRAILVDA